MVKNKKSGNWAILFMACLIGIAVLPGVAMAITAPIEEWNKTYGGTGYDYARSVQQTSDGGYIFAGYTDSYLPGNNDAWLVKTYPNGSEEWNKAYPGANSDFAFSTQQTSDGGYVVAGQTSSYGAGNNDAWLFKTYVDGNQEWSKVLGGTGYDHVSSVQQTSDGGYIFAGSTTSSGAGGYDAWLIKTYPNGTQEWSKTFGGTGRELIYSVRQTSDGGYILAGVTNTFGAGNDDIWLVKTYPNGTQEWNKTFGGSVVDYARSVQQTSDEGYILAGFTASYGAGNNDAWLIKTYPNGTHEWNKTFGGADYDVAYSAQQTSDDGYVIAVVINTKTWLIKTYPDGNEEWSKMFEGLNSEIQSVQQTSDNGYILAGSRNADAWLIKVASDAIPPTPTPDKPTELKQLKSDGTTVIAQGTTTNEKTIVFKGLVSDPDGHNVKLQIELRRNDEYGNEFNESKGGLKNSSLVPNGSIATITVNDLINAGYHWRARTIDANENVGPWQDFDGNPVSDADFIVNVPIIPPPPKASTGFAFPLKGYTPYTAPVGAIMDHSMSEILKMDGIVRAFDGEQGNVSNGCQYYKDGAKFPCTEKNYMKYNKYMVAYNNSGGTIFLPQLNYKDPYLYYDGHPGYDFNQQPKGTHIFAPANGTLCIILDDKKTAGVLWRNSTTCTNLSAAKQTLGTWIAEHSLYIIHNGLEINGTTGDYITVFIHNDNLSESIYNEVKKNGYAKVNKSQYIANVGGYAKGKPNTFGPHIHLEVFKRNGKVWDRVDPYGDGINNILWEAGKAPVI